MTSTSRHKKEKKRKKKKYSAEEQEKHVLYLPKRESGERFPDLQIPQSGVRLTESRQFSLAVTNTTAMQWREFLRLQLPSEKIHRRVYNLGTGPNVEITLAKPRESDQWMLYRSYIRADELTVLDYKETKLFYLQYMPQGLLTMETDLSLQYITDWISIAFIMRNEMERRRNGVRSFGKGKPVTATDLCIAPLHATHRKSYAKEQLRNIKIWPQMVAEMASDIVKSVEHRLLFVENLIRFGGASKVVKEFIEENKEWIDERLKLNNINKRITVGKNHIEELNTIHPFESGYQLVSELHELPPSLGHAVFFCRALRDLTLTIRREEIVRKVTKSDDAPLLVHPSRYEYKPSAVTVYKESLDTSEPLALDFQEAPTRAPSVNSLSGFSSDSAASTATQSPGDWQHNWKMQTMHHDMEHRLMDSSIQNPLEERELGELEAAQRIADEVNRRVALLNDKQRCEAIFGGKYSEVSQYYHDIFHDEQLGIRRNTKQLKRLKTEAKKLLDSVLSAENSALDLQLADYIFNELLRMAPEYAEDPYDGLGINNAWKTLIDNDVVKKQSRACLKAVFSSHHSWVNASMLSQQYVVPRCDQLPCDVMTPAEYSTAPASWILACIVIFVICAVVLGFLIKSS
uniref:CRAL-TRIO domain-containing protein n=2 Tax=Haemonchus contortus TaxID=6289 RepID=A0A7I5ECM9_HAECO